MSAVSAMAEVPRIGAHADVVWTWARFDALAAADVYDFLALRSEVFVVEQGCPFLDADGFDSSAWHLLGRAPESASAPGSTSLLLAYLRVLDAGVKYQEPSIGRVITRASHRRTGLGRALMREGLARAASVWPGRAIRIAAQQRLEAFYASLGFTSVGAPYLEDGIDHIEMLRAAHHSASAGDPELSNIDRERIAS